MRDEELTTMPTSTTTVKPHPLAPIFNVPGVVWIGLIAALTKWVSDSFPDQPWAPAVVIVLGGIAKLIQMYWPKGDAQPAEPAPMPAGVPMDGDDHTWHAPTAPAKQPNKLAQLLIG